MNVKTKTKPALKKSGFLWVCSGAGRHARGKTPASAYANWYRLLEEMNTSYLSLLRENAEATRKHEAELRAVRDQMIRASLGKSMPDEWIVRRICFYNQKCIDHIWATKTLPNQSEYMAWTGRTSRSDEVQR